MTPKKVQTMRRIQLECDHILMFAKPVPRIGEDAWCPKCTEYRAITVAPAEYRIRCRDCTISRGYGAAKLSAQLAADVHHRRRPGHEVRVFDGDVLLEVRASNVGQLALPGLPEARARDSDDAPF